MGVGVSYHSEKSYRILRGSLLVFCARFKGMIQGTASAGEFLRSICIDIIKYGVLCVCTMYIEYVCKKRKLAIEDKKVTVIAQMFAHTALYDGFLGFLNHRCSC